MTTPTATLRALLAASILLLAGPTFGQDQGAGTPTPVTGQPSGPVQPSADAKARLRLLLSGYHGLPPKAEFETIAGVKALLYVFAHDASDALHRDRALAALAYFPDGSVFRLYAEILGDASTPEGTRHRVMRLLAEAFGDRALPLLRPYLEADDLRLRLTAVAAVGDIGSDAATDALRARIDRETHPVVRERLERAGRQLR